MEWPGFLAPRPFAAAMQIVGSELARDSEMKIARKQASSIEHCLQFPQKKRHPLRDGARQRQV
jgi:hypothetical protein